MVLSRFTRGVRVPFDGFAYLRQHPGLWPYVIPVALVNIVITGAALLVLILLAVVLVGWVQPMFGAGWVQLILKVLVIAAVIVVVVGLTVVCWLLMQNVIGDHLMSKLAQRVEKQLGLAGGEIASVPFSRQVKDGLRETGLILGIHLGAFAAQFAPGIGLFVGLPAALTADAYIVGSGIMNHPLNLRGMAYEDRRAFIRKHRPETIGIGAATLPLGLIPIVGGLVVASAVVGSVRLYRDLRPQPSA